MAVVYGQIESLRRIRETLDQKGITRFNSIGDINRFLSNYDAEKEELLFRIERDYELELEALQSESLGFQRKFDSLKSNTTDKLNNSLQKLKTRCKRLSSAPTRNAVLELLQWYQLQILLGAKFILEKSYNGIIWIRTHQAENELKASIKRINNHITNRKEIISERFDSKLKELQHAKSVATKLYPTIAGAIGENKVAEELKGLPDGFVLINDYSIKFDKPIYHRQQRSRIFSIQIDHLLITHAGIFIIETKNWSKSSVKRYDLRSPIKQIQRANYALFTILQRTEAEEGIPMLKTHHWGNKRIPIRNIVAMINHRPREMFNYVAIKKLNEIKGYINHFEPVFDSSEVRAIAKFLMRLKN